jgi:hypothetical protein
MSYRIHIVPSFLNQSAANLEASEQANEEILNQIKST